MKKLRIIGVVAALVWFKFGANSGSNVNAVDANGNPVVMVFTVDNCQGHCKKATKELTKRNVPFEEMKINPANGDDLNTIKWKKMGKRGFPYIASGKERVTGSSKAQIASLLGVTYGDKYLTRAEKRYYSKHFNSDGSPKIIMYGADWCPYCAKLKKEFEDEGIDYTEIDVEKQKRKKKLVRVMGISGYPTTYVGYSRVDGSTLKDVKKKL